MRYKTLIFDLDGTLLNTLQDLAAATNYTLKKHGFPERSMDEVRMFVGNGIRKLIQRAVPQEQAKQCRSRFLLILMCIIRSIAQIPPVPIPVF